jgi:hypothetical protein
VVEITPVVYEVPEYIEEPPVEAAYQLMVPAEAAAERGTVPAPHLEPLVTLVIVGIGLIYAYTGVRVAVVQT